MIALLAGVLIFGVKINGARAWFDFGFMRLQPAEFTKMATAMILGRYVAATGVKLTDFSSQLKSLAIIGLPIALIALQPDFGSIIIFAALIIPLYREGFPSIYLIIGISVSIFFILTLLIPRTELLIGIAALGLILVSLLQKSKVDILYPFRLSHHSRFHFRH